MLNKSLSILISCGHFDEGIGAILATLEDGQPNNIFVKLYEIEQLAYKEMSFKDFFYFKRWWQFCSAEQKHISNFGIGSPKKHSCEIILKSGHKSRRAVNEGFFSIFSSGGHFVQSNATIFIFLVEGNTRIISVKLF